MRATRLAATLGEATFDVPMFGVAALGAARVGAEDCGVGVASFGPTTDIAVGHAVRRIAPNCNITTAATTHTAVIAAACGHQANHLRAVLSDQRACCNAARMRGAKEALGSALAMSESSRSMLAKSTCSAT